MILLRGARAALLLALAGALPACGDGAGAQAPASMTQNERQAVSDAAEMLHERVPAGPDETPETAGQDSNR